MSVYPIKYKVLNKETGRKVTTLIGRETQVFVHDDSFTKDAMHLLSSVADEISGSHFALMNELGQGGLA